MFGGKLTGRVEKLEDRVQTLERELQGARLDWLDVYGKAKKLFGRIAKAQDRAEAAETEAATAETAASGANGSPVLTTLSPRARLIQQQILARRRAMGGKESE